MLSSGGENYRPNVLPMQLSWALFAEDVQNCNIFLHRLAKFALSFSCSSAKELAATGFLGPWPPAVPWTPAGGSTPNPHYWPVLPVHHVPPTYSVAPCFMEFWCCRLDVAIRIRTALPKADDRQFYRPIFSAKLELSSTAKFIADKIGR